MKDLEHAFFDPLWIRIVIVCFLGSLMVYEFTLGRLSFGLLTFAAFAVCMWSFFFNPNRKDRS